MPTQEERLNKLVAAGSTPQKVVLRASIVLQYLAGVNKSSIARRLNTSRPTVDLWIGRYLAENVEGLLRDKTRPGRKRKISLEQEKAIIDATLHASPSPATHWTERSMAARFAVSGMSIHRIWKKYNLQPHLTHGFKISTDPHFADKLIDVIGLYMNPPEKAIVYCVDEKSQIQALDRTQPGLPMKPGRKGTMTHDYKRNGTTTLFAALNMLNGIVIGECHEQHRAKEFLSFLRTLNRETPRGYQIHVILDNYATHKTADVRLWLEKHPRFHFHFTPTSASWLNMVERFFSEITNKAIRRGVFYSVEMLIESIYKFINAHNSNPKIFKWTKDAETIMNKVNICKEALVAEH